ncbi:MAG: glycosyltransferase, partial [Candidatus Binatia bacterium]
AEAIRPVVEKDPRLHFLLIGDGNLRFEFESRVREEGVESSVTLAGLVPHQDVPQHLAACDILVSPHVRPADGSEFFGSPTKLFEYMAMGKGIVASKLGQIGEVLRDGETAILVKPGDPKDLASGILRLVSDEALRRQLGRRAREVVAAEYTWKRNAERVLEVAHRLLEQKR